MIARGTTALKSEFTVQMLPVEHIRMSNLGQQEVLVEYHQQCTLFHILWAQVLLETASFTFFISALTKDKWRAVSLAAKWQRSWNTVALCSNDLAVTMPALHSWHDRSYLSAYKVAKCKSEGYSDCKCQAKSFY